MVSLRARLFKPVLKWKLCFNGAVVPNLAEEVKKQFAANYKEVPKKGYTIIHKETENKTRYIIIRKDSNQTAKKVIFYLHGGIYIMPLLDMFYPIAYKFCNMRDDLEVVLLDYDTAPEFKYPTQLNQAMEVWNILTKTYRPEDIIIGGDSAGGNLNLALTLKLQNDFNISPKACFFLSPWTDMTCSGQSYKDNYQVDIIFGESKCPLTEEKRQQIVNSEFHCYIKPEDDRNDPYISPVFADYKIFPNSLFIVGSEEVLLDDTIRIVDKLKANGKEVDLIKEEGMFHDYPLYYHVIPEGQMAFNKIKEFINENFK